jgi:ADP-ribosylglycohydrolase
MTPLERALLSLNGLSVGDALGETCFSLLRTRFDRQLPPAPWRWTDDTEMALSIVAVLKQHGRIEQDALATNFAEHFHQSRGYGRAMSFLLLPALRSGRPWRTAAPELFAGEGSLGNGAAMRVAPVGGYFANDLQRAAAEAVRSAEVTHAHPEALAGAIAVTIAAALAWQWRGREIAPRELLKEVLPFVPDSEVRDGLERAMGLCPYVSLLEAVTVLGCGERVTCIDTVPFCLWNAARFFDDYPEALWSTVKAGGDIDTNAAIVGGIVALSACDRPLPTTWMERREPWSVWFQETLAR